MASYYTFQDHSGLDSSKVYDNPYDSLIEQCSRDPSDYLAITTRTTLNADAGQAKIQAIYEKHRTNRNAQQKQKLLADDFPGVTIDQILAKLEDPVTYPEYEDPRNCLVFWARPPASLRELIDTIQTKLKKILPNLWIMPQMSLHMTALEITHSLTAPEIDALVEQMISKVPEIADFTLTHRARLVKPMISYDAQALALSFLPAAGETGRALEEDKYSYHQLRRDLYAEAGATGVKVASRYVVPSAHLTIARFITTKDLEDGAGSVDHKKMQLLVATIEEINEWLQKSYWPTEEQPGQQWLVGEERGLTYRKGTLWYGGGGETIVQGRGF